VQEEAEPGALAAPLAADAVHAVVPVAGADQRQAVGAAGQPAVDGAQAVLEEGAPLGGHLRLQVGLVGSLGQRRRGEVGHHLVEHAGVAGGGHVARRHVGQPEEVVGAAGAGALAGRRLPPVLDVPLDELAAGGAQQVLARQGRGARRAAPASPGAGRGSRRRRPAASSRPAPTGGSPSSGRAASGSSSRRRSRRACAPRWCRATRPSRCTPRGGRLGGGQVAVARHQVAGRRRVPPWPSTKTSRRTDFARRHLQRHLERGAGVEPGAEAARELRVAERGGGGERAVAAEERGAVAGRRARRLAGVRERHARGEVAVVGVAGEDRPGRLVALGDDVQVPSGGRRPERPLRRRRR
jgi:hypothetical protein